MTGPFHTVFTFQESRSADWRKSVDHELKKLHQDKLYEIHDLFTSEGLVLSDIFEIDGTEPMYVGVREASNSKLNPDAFLRITRQLRSAAGRNADLLQRYGDGSIEALRLEVIEHLHIPRSEEQKLSKSIEARIRAGHHGDLQVCKDEATRKFLSEKSGPLPLRGPTDVHQVDEMFARIHSRSPWLRRATSRIWTAARARAAAGIKGLSFPPVLLWGPGGTGKTELASIIAEEPGTSRLEFDATAGAAGFRLAGVEAGFSTSMIGEPLRHIGAEGIANPVIVINEIDKAVGGISKSSGRSTSLVDALLPFLERKTSATFRCPATGLLCDFSRVNWILTGNEIKHLLGPLRTRLEIVEVAELSLNEYLEASEVLCSDDLSALRAVKAFIVDPHEHQHFSLRHVLRAIERAKAVEKGYPWH